ncbi:hypothetical protein [Rhizobium sp. Leaf391]|uniref:hypothetical protein n=1 Tax=Rhizobium sp. Leaf391 TaxID=1736360 RepID=UPI000AA50DDF|nr:hypothetical protein [Rhizobium sp. Leaf391]
MSIPPPIRLDDLSVHPAAIRACAAGEHGDGDRAALSLRVKRAVLGYLGTAPQA